MSDHYLDEIAEFFDDAGASALRIDGFDEAIIAIGEQHPGPPVLVYSYEKLVACAAKDPGSASRESAQEYVDCNIVSAHLGERTPIIVYKERGR